MKICYFGTLKACLTMPGYAHSHASTCHGIIAWSICRTNGYLSTYKKSSRYSLFKIRDIQNERILQSDWPRAFLSISWEPYFSPTWSFRRISTEIRQHLNPKNTCINGLNFPANWKNTVFGVFLGIIPKMRFFPKNPALSVFHP